MNSSSAAAGKVIAVCFVGGGGAGGAGAAGRTPLPTRRWSPRSEAEGSAAEFELISTTSARPFAGSSASAARYPPVIPSQCRGRPLSSSPLVQTQRLPLPPAGDCCNALLLSRFLMVRRAAQWGFVGAIQADWCKIASWWWLLLPIEYRYARPNRVSTFRPGIGRWCETVTRRIQR